MDRSNFVIAIDGFSSCGKSTVAKALAKKLHFVFVDSGAMYRAVTFYFLKHNIALDNEEQVQAAVSDIHIDLIAKADTTQVLLNGVDVTAEVRSMEVSSFVSEVSSLRSVRRAMVLLQQELGSKRNIVMDGRDIGTTVFPDADLKIFMTADPYVRAERRYAELAAKGEEWHMDKVIDNLAHRDHIDSTREESPLRQASDAIVLDNSLLNQDEQLEFVLDLYTQACNKRKTL